MIYKTCKGKSGESPLFHFTKRQSWPLIVVMTAFRRFVSG